MKEVLFDFWDDLNELGSAFLCCLVIVVAFFCAVGLFGFALAITMLVLWAFGRGRSAEARRWVARVQELERRIR